MAPNTTNYNEIQKDEIEALRAIYPDDFEEEKYKVGAWNKPADLAFRIKLRGNEGESSDLTATLSVSLPPTYPKTLPKLALEFGSGVPERIKNAAGTVLEEQAKRLLGTEMIYDITVALQETFDGALPTETTKGPTLEEERVASEQAAKSKALEEEAKHAKELQIAEEDAAEREAQALHQLISQEKARSERLKKLARDSADPSLPVSEIPNGISFERASAKTKDPSGKAVQITRVSQKIFIREGPTSRLYLVQPYPSADSLSDSKPFLCLKEAIVSGDPQVLKPKLQELEWKMDAQINAPPHQAVSQPLNFRIQRMSSYQGDTSGWSINTLSRFTSKGSLQDFLGIAETVDLKRLKTWAVQLLEGLHHFHQQGAAHGFVHLSNVLLWENESAIPTVKWSDGLYGCIVNRLKNITRVPTPIGWAPPEVLATKNDATPQGNTDVWYFGVCLAQMAFGQDVLRNYEAPQSLIDDHDLTQSFKSVLKGVFEFHLKRRPSAWDLLHFEFFWNDDSVEDALPHVGEFSRLRKRRESEAPPETSEYARKFVEEGRIGKGGFGEVFRARNRTDAQLYAVKKIKARSRAALVPVLSEVTVLSRLNHPHVVRYYASWIEDSNAVATNRSVDDTQQESVTDSMSGLFFQNSLHQSSRGLDFISSNNVVFGDPDASDTEEETDSEADEDESASSVIERRQSKIDDNADSAPFSSELFSDAESLARVKSRQYATILYIQMEYCRQETLRDIINAGVPSNTHEHWRLFRQIALGLAYIHAASIVHRDLKPENIFVDSKGELRIGDFGLARPGEYKVPAGTSNPRTQLGSFTRNIGTAWYIAPEVRSGGGGGTYDQKADMYSLGIIFLEMNVAFSTNMERAETLESMAKPDHRLPAALRPIDKEDEAKMLLSLTEVQPDLRPDCGQLLQQIPMEEDDQLSQRINQELRESDSQLRPLVLSALFGRSRKDDPDEHPFTEPDINRKIRLLEGITSLSRDFSDLDLQSRVKRELIEIFQRHGGVERTDTPAAFPYHPCYASAEVVRLLDTSGQVLQLPYDLILPNALRLAKTMRKDSHTFAFGDVYRPDPRHSEPRIFGEVVFDITRTNTSRLGLDEAEIIKLVDGLLDRFPQLSGSQMCYHVNHSKLLDKILRHCNVDSAKWFEVKECLSKLNIGDWTWPRIRQELRAPPISIPTTCLEELELFDFREVLGKAISKIRTMLGDTVDIETTFAQLALLSTYLGRMQVQRKVYSCPLMSYNEKFYRGHFLFQCLHDKKRKTVFAAGGRYDELIREHQTIASRNTAVHGVGFQLSWSGICQGILSFIDGQEKSRSKRKNQAEVYQWKSARYDVLVDSYGESLIDTVGVTILNDLWANNFSARLASSGSTATGNNATNKHPDYDWLVLIRSSDVVKVKDVSKQEDHEIRIVELLHFLRAERRDRERDRERTSVRQALPALTRNQSHPEGKIEGSHRGVKVFGSQNKGKKSNRKAIFGDAMIQVSQWRQSSQYYPIIAIEAKDDMLQAIQKIRFDDTESWRKLVQASPPNERQYLAQVQPALRDYLEDGAVFIYSYRTKGLILYPLV